MSAAELIARIRRSDAAKVAAGVSRWWFRELRGMGEDVVAYASPALAAIVSTRPDGDGFLLERRVKGQPVETKNVPVVQERSTIEAELPASFKAARTILVLPPSAVLIDSVTLPGAARSQIRRALDLQLGHRMPLRRELVYWDFEVTTENQDIDAVVVDLAITRREQVDAWVAQLAALGLRVVRVAMGESAEAPMRFQFRAHRGASTGEVDHAWNRRLAMSCGVLILALGCSVGWQWHTERQQAESTLAAARSQAQTATSIREEIYSKLKVSDALRTGGATPSAAKIIMEVGGRLTAAAWLTQFEMKGAEVRVSGIAPAQTNIAVTLEPSSLIRGVSLESSTSLGVGTDRDRFVVSFNAVQEKPR